MFTYLKWGCVSSSCQCLWHEKCMIRLFVLWVLAGLLAGALVWFCVRVCAFFLLLKWKKKLVWPLEKSSFQSVECEMEAFSFLPKGFNERIDYSALSTFRIVERESALLPFTFFSQTVSLMLQHICFYKKESAYMYEQNRKNRILCCSLCIAVASV